MRSLICFKAEWYGQSETIREPFCVIVTAREGEEFVRKSIVSMALGGRLMRAMTHRHGGCMCGLNVVRAGGAK